MHPTFSPRPCVTWETMFLAPMPGPDELRLDSYLRDSYPRLVNSLRGRFSERIAAEDVVQETLVRAWLMHAEGERIRSLAPWMTAAATNLARTRWRTLQAEERALGRAAFDQRPGLDSGLGGPTDLGLDGPLAEAIRQLPRRQAQAVLLHYLGDLSISEAAARMGVSEGTVKGALHDARERLGRLLEGRQLDKRRRTMIGWHLAGSQPGQYDHEITQKTAYGKPVARLWCTAKKAEGFGTLMQTFLPGDYLGKRLRLSGGLACEDVDGWAGLWMRVDGPRAAEPLAFDNMENRSLKGARDWQRYEVVLDVPDDARAIALGVLLAGRGEVLIAGLGVEVVGEDVPVTNLNQNLPEGPQNLDFSETAG